MRPLIVWKIPEIRWWEVCDFSSQKLQKSSKCQQVMSKFPKSGRLYAHRENVFSRRFTSFPVDWFQIFWSRMKCVICMSLHWNILCLIIINLSTPNYSEFDNDCEFYSSFMHDTVKQQWLAYLVESVEIWNVQSAQCHSTLSCCKLDSSGKQSFYQSCTIFTVSHRNAPNCFCTTGFYPGVALP